MKKTMRPKDRVRAAFAHETPDRVPIDYLCNPGIDHRLKAHFGLQSGDDEGLRQALGVDFRHLLAPYVGPRRFADIPGRRINEWGMRTRWIGHSSGGYWDYCDFPLKEATLEDIRKWPWPDPDDFDYASLREQCRRWPDYYLIFGDPGFGDCINSASMLRTMEEVLIDLYDDEAETLAIFDHKLEVQLGIVERALDKARGAIDMLWLGEDLGTQIAPILSLELFRKHIRPRHQKLVDLARSYNIPVMLHSCGSSSWAFEDLIEMGITVIDTLQPEAVNMDPLYLKSRYGERLSFHGCISTAGPVANGSVEDTIRDTREKLDILMPGGGYALSPTHQLQDNSKLENVIALYETAREFGRYGSIQ